MPVRRSEVSWCSLSALKARSLLRTPDQSPKGPIAPHRHLCVANCQAHTEDIVEDYNRTFDMEGDQLCLLEYYNAQLNQTSISVPSFTKLQLHAAN